MIPQELFKKFGNLYQSNPTLAMEFAQKALSTDAGSGGSLDTVEWLGKLVNLTRYICPEIELITSWYGRGKTIDQRRLVSLGQPGAAIGEKADYFKTDAEYDDYKVPKKRVGQKRDITGFLVASEDKRFDSPQMELQNALMSMMHTILTFFDYGNAKANKWEFDGWNVFIKNFSSTSTSQEGTKLTSLKILRRIIANALNKGSVDIDLAILCSPVMRDHLTDLGVGTGANTQKVINLEAKQQFGLDIGLIADALAGIPIILSARCQPRDDADHNIGAVTLVKTDAGGTVPAATYYAKVAPITDGGEQLASSEVSVVAGSATSTLTVAWNSVPNALKYWIFIGTATGVTYFKKEVPAFTYDSDGNVTGRKEEHTFLTDPTVADDTVGTSRENYLPLKEAVSGEYPQCIKIINFHPDQGLGGFEHCVEGGTNLEFLKMGVRTPEQIGEERYELQANTYGALTGANETDSAWFRGLLPEK